MAGANGFVAATALASPNEDYDNETSIRRMARFRGCSGDAERRLETLARPVRRQVRFYRLQVGPRASWDNARNKLLGASRGGEQDRDCCRTLATQPLSPSAPLRTAILAQPHRDVSRLNNLSFALTTHRWSSSSGFTEEASSACKQVSKTSPGTDKRVFRTP